MPDQHSTSEMARAIQDVTERAQLLVREEIELAKAEVTDKVMKLVKGAIFGVIAGIFAVFALIYLLNALAWGIWDLAEIGDAPWFGFLVVGVLLIALGALGGLLALKLLKRGAPPTPQMAIEEAQLIKGTLTTPAGGHPVGPVTPVDGGRR